MAYNVPQNLIFISTVTASSSASLSFVSGISSNFKTYMVKIRKLVAATSATSLNLTFSTNGGSTYLSTGYLNGNLTTTSNVDRTYSTTGTSQIVLATTLSNTSANDLNQDITLYNLNSGTFCAKVTYHAVCYNSSAFSQTQIGGGMNTGTTAVNALKFSMASGNITSGTISLYGVVE